MDIWQKQLGLDLQIPDDFGHWFAGFVDGEGCFTISKKPARHKGITLTFTIKLRDDDDGILHEIKNTLGIGRIYYRNKEYVRERGHFINNQVDWRVRRIGDIIHVIIPLFEKYPLRAKKKHDFKIWSQAAQLIYAKYHLTETGRKEVLRLKDELSEVRRYKG